MRRLRPIVATLLAAATALASASTTLAKGEDAVVTLDSALPPGAMPGTVLEVGWIVTIALDDGSVEPFNAEGIFIRLRPAAGEPVEFGASQDRAGHYVATVTIPKGGLGTIEVGLRGTACMADGQCQRADELFAVAGTAVDAGSGADVAPLSPGQEAGIESAAFGGPGASLLPLAAAAAAVALGAGLITRRGRGRELA